jgi:type II secretory pathway pseudopilin PulG
MESIVPGHTKKKTMENRNTGNANDAYNPNSEWISDENRDSQVQGATEDQLNSLSAAEDSYNASSQTRYTSDARDDDDKADDNEEENDDDDTDWGTVDPLDAPGSLPDPMDPSGPGSAV